MTASPSFVRSAMALLVGSVLSMGAAAQSNTISSSSYRANEVVSLVFRGWTDEAILNGATGAVSSCHAMRNAQGAVIDTHPPLPNPASAAPVGPNETRVTVRPSGNFIYSTATFINGEFVDMVGLDRQGLTHIDCRQLNDQKAPTSTITHAPGAAQVVFVLDGEYNVDANTLSCQGRYDGTNYLSASIPVGTDPRPGAIEPITQQHPLTRVPMAGTVVDCAHTDRGRARPGWTR